MCIKQLCVLIILCPRSLVLDHQSGFSQAAARAKQHQVWVPRALATHTRTVTCLLYLSDRICQLICFCSCAAQAARQDLDSSRSNQAAAGQEEVRVPRALAKDTWAATHDSVQPSLNVNQQSLQPSGALVRTLHNTSCHMQVTNWLHGYVLVTYCFDWLHASYMQVTNCSHVGHKLVTGRSWTGYVLVTCKLQIGDVLMTCRS